MKNHYRIISRAFLLLLTTACFCMVIFHVTRDMRGYELSLADRVPCSTLSINIPMSDFEAMSGQDSFSLSPDEKHAAYLPAILQPYMNSCPGCIWQPPKIS